MDRLPDLRLDPDRARAVHHRHDVPEPGPPARRLGLTATRVSASRRRAARSRSQPAGDQAGRRDPAHRAYAWRWRAPGAEHTATIPMSTAITANGTDQKPMPIAITSPKIRRRDPPPPSRSSARAPAPGARCLPCDLPAGRSGQSVPSCTQRVRDQVASDPRRSTVPDPGRRRPGTVSTTGGARDDDDLRSDRHHLHALRQARPAAVRRPVPDCMDELTVRFPGVAREVEAEEYTPRSTSPPTPSPSRTTDRSRGR